MLCLDDLTRNQWSSGCNDIIFSQILQLDFQVWSPCIQSILVHWNVYSETEQLIPYHIRTLVIARQLVLITTAAENIIETHHNN